LEKEEFEYLSAKDNILEMTDISIDQIDIDALSNELLNYTLTKLII
jgi:hypothetical protein